MIYVLAGIAVLLTVTMFKAKEMLLGFPCAIFWAIFGGYCYIQSTATWDIYYLTFFAAMGMAIFSMYAMYALRVKDLSGPDADKGKYIDEMDDPDLRGNVEKDKEYGVEGGYIDEVTTPSNRRTQGLRDRAQKRKTVGIRKKPDWGEFK